MAKRPAKTQKTSTRTVRVPPRRRPADTIEEVAEQADERAALIERSLIVQWLRKQAIVIERGAKRTVSHLSQATPHERLDAGILLTRGAVIRGIIDRLVAGEHTKG